MKILKYARVVGLSIALTTLTIRADAQVQAQPRAALANDNVSEGLGLVINSTRTAGGNLFYRSFLDYWREKSDSENFSIDIGELFSKRYGSQIWVGYGQKTVFISRLPAKSEKINALGEQAADATYDAIISQALKFNIGIDLDISQDDEF